nr:sigma-54-dependent Fis family transcriptional regulator [uncultured Marinobacter sp.]
MGLNEYSDYRSDIADSWNRCIAWGLDHEHQPAPPSPGARELEGNDQAHAELLSCAEAEVVPYYRNILSSSRCLILLADRQGTVLRNWGDRRTTEERLQPWFQPGANWQEQHCGTNAIGTAIATGAPVQIQRNEHFLKQNRSIIGSAAPIFNARKEIAGVLSVFSDAYLPQAHTLGMVRLLSQSVENRLMTREFEHDYFQITLSNTKDNFDSPWSGILICDDSGGIVASNQRADQMLGRDVTGARLEDLFTSRRNHILGQPEREPMQLTTHNKVRLSGRLKRPARKEPPAPSAKAETTGVRARSTRIPLDHIEHGDLTVRRGADQALKVLQRGVPVLITGETGVGKEVLVKALHDASHRRTQALVAVNCAAIPPELVESELFGYEAGAFTGARAQGSLGLIRKAHQGILFLDEIGEMPLSAQSRLLRVLQEREVTPVGSTERIPVDLLLVTATNRPLSGRVESGAFRADLYYRINGLRIELPALRDRADRRELIQRLYQTHRDQGQSAQLSPRVMAALESHPWPGNLRQLDNVIRVAVAIADGEDVQLWHLPDDFLSGFEALPLGQSPAQTTGGRPEIVSDISGEADPLGQTLRVYQQCLGNVSRAAKELSISRNTLYKRLRELGVR